MRDYCTMWITIRPRDAAKVLQLLGEWDSPTNHSPDSNKAIKATYEEINYGAFKERQALAKSGVVFTGSHSSGYEYSACEFAGVNGLLYEVPIFEDHFIIRADKKGNPLKHSLRRLKKFIQACSKAKALLTCRRKESECKQKSTLKKRSTPLKVCSRNSPSPLRRISNWSGQLGSSPENLGRK